MKVPLFIAMTISICLSGVLHNDSTLHFSKVHQMCVDNFQNFSKHREAVSALVCGARLQDQHIHSLFVKSQLLHLLIVSGSHLVFLDQLMGFFRIPFFVRFFMCLIYCFACNFEAPVVRALGANLLRGLFKIYGCHLPRDREPLLSSLWCLLIKPQWAQSLSFMMSWCASLSLNGPFKGPVALAATSYVLMWAPILWISSSHPIGIAFNLFLAPLLSFVLFPLALSTLILPTEAVFNWVFDILLLALEHLTQGLPPPRESLVAWPFLTLWLWVLSFHFLFYWRRRVQITAQIAKP